MVGVSARGRDVFKQLAYRSGFLGRYHRVRNRDTLTVVAFHRVLARTDERWAHADPRYTITDEQLDQCLAFFARHYAIVDLAAVRAAARGGGVLPPRALLVTFDDGWADTAEYALPVLRRRAVPAAVFVASAAVDAQRAFWQERVFRAWRLGAAPEQLADETSARQLVERLRALPPPERAPLVDALDAALPPSRELLTRAQLRALEAAGIALGAHGVTHEALAETHDAGELLESKAQLVELLDGATVEAMSFPHGSYDDALLRESLSHYELVFTSDWCLNSLVRGRPSRVLGRVEIRGKPIVDARGRVRSDLLALWLFRRRRQPGGTV